MKTAALGLNTILACLLCLLLFAGCTAPAVEETQTPDATQQPEAQTAAVVNVSDTLIGFIIPQSEELSLCTAMHGFLRTAENLGYPAKLYHAKSGTASVAAVEQASEEGCSGLLIWSPDGANASAIARAAELSIPVVVPYFSASGTGVTANAVADLMGYTEEVAMGVAERMVERECKAGKILVYGRTPVPTYNGFVSTIATYYPQYNVAYFTRTASEQQAAIDELANHILWNRDIKGLFCTDVDGALIAVRAREQAQSIFKRDGAPEGTASPSPKDTPKTSLTPSPSPAPSASPVSTPPVSAGSMGTSVTPVPSGLIQSITISVAGYGISDDAIALMRENDIYAFVLEPYYEASAQSLMLLDRILNSESVPAASRLNMPIVRMATLDKYVLLYEQVQDWFSLRKAKENAVD